MSFDNAGNLTNDTYTGQGQLTFDGENRMNQLKRGQACDFCDSFTITSRSRV